MHADLCASGRRFPESSRVPRPLDTSAPHGYVPALAGYPVRQTLFDTCGKLSAAALARSALVKRFGHEQCKMENQGGEVVSCDCAWGCPCQVNALSTEGRIVLSNGFEYQESCIVVANRSCLRWIPSSSTMGVTMALFAACVCPRLG